MKGFLSKVWFPVAVVAAVTAQVIGPEERVESRRIPAHDPDTVIYAVPGYKKGWEEDALLFAAAERDSLALAPGFSFLGKLKGNGLKFNFPAAVINN